MRGISYSIIITIFLTACQTDIPAGTEIVFADVIGSYEGECADYSSITSELMNREDAVLTVFAASTTSAGIKTSCDRIMDQSLPVLSASAAQIVFERVFEDTKVTMTYIAVSDSIVIMHTTEGNVDNLIFTGTRN